MDRLTGIHAIREALEAGSAFDRILIAKGRQDTRVEEIVQLARAQNIPVRFEDRSQLDRLANSRDHQGVVAIAAARPPATLESLLDHANKSKGQIGLIVLLDGVEDPHNLGAIIRTALADGSPRLSGRPRTPARSESDESRPRNGRFKGSRLLARRTG
jgi:23S rRNA (guanosine2251-2'-O)-methyltransferase